MVRVMHLLRGELGPKALRLALQLRLIVVAGGRLLPGTQQPQAYGQKGVSNVVKVSAGGIEVALHRHDTV